MDPGPSAPVVDDATERNTVLLEKSNNPDVNSENRQTCREYGIHAGKGELRRLQKFVSQAIIKLLNRYNLTQNNGNPYVSSCPKGFLQGPDAWLGQKGYQISGWPRGLPCGSISIWPSAYIFALAVMFINGTIDLKPSGGCTVTWASEGLAGPGRRRRRRKTDFTANSGHSGPQARGTLVDGRFKSTEYIADSDEAGSESEVKRSLVSTTRTSVLDSGVTQAGALPTTNNIELVEEEGSDDDNYESDSDDESYGGSVVGKLSSSPKYSTYWKDGTNCVSRTIEANLCPGKRDEHFEELPFSQSQESPTSRKTSKSFLGKDSGGTKTKACQATDVQPLYINSAPSQYSNLPHSMSEQKTNLNTSSSDAPDDNEHKKSSIHSSSSSSDLSSETNSDVERKQSGDVPFRQKQSFETNSSNSESSEASSVEDFGRPVRPKVANLNSQISSESDVFVYSAIRPKAANPDGQSSSESDESDKLPGRIIQDEQRLNNSSSSREKDFTSEDSNTRSSNVSKRTNSSVSPLKDRKVVAKANLSKESSSESSESSSDSSDSDGGLNSNAPVGSKNVPTTLSSVKIVDNLQSSSKPSLPSTLAIKARNSNAIRAKGSLFPLPVNFDLSTTQSIESIVSAFAHNSSLPGKSSESNNKRKTEIELEYPGVPTGATINWLPPTSATRTEVKKRRRE